LSDGDIERQAAMARPIKVWFDSEADFLEVLFSEKAGFMRETDNDDVMERVNEQGEILGFSVMNVRQHKSQHPLAVELV